MPQVVDFAPKEAAFRRFQFKPMLQELLQHSPQSDEMLFWCMREHDDIIKVDQGVGQVELPQKSSA